jgi:integrase
MNSVVTLSTTTSNGISYWQARWICPRTGRRRCKSLGRKDKVSERTARRMIVQIEVAFDKDPLKRALEAAPTLDDWLDKFIVHIKNRQRATSTIADYEVVCKMLSAHFGPNQQVGKIVKSDLEQFWLRMSNDDFASVLNRKNKVKASATTVTKYMRYVRRIFTAAFDDGILVRNPAAKLGLAATPASEWTKVSIGEFWQLYDSIDPVRDPGVATLIALCRLAALRKGDAINLKWENIRDGTLVFQPQKIKRFAKQQAVVPICFELAEILNKVREESVRIDGFVLCRSIPLSMGEYVFPRLCKQAGLKPWPKPLHTLRKSCIDDWSKVVGPTTLMEWATHTSLQTTVKFYTKVSKDDLLQGQSRLFARPCPIGKAPTGTGE